MAGNAVLDFEQELSNCRDGRLIGYNILGPKSGGGLLFPFPWGSWVPIEHKHNVAWAEAYLHTTWHPDISNRLATIHQRYRQDREKNGHVAQGGRYL